MSNIWLRANQRKTRTQNHQNLTTVLLRLSKYWHILHRSATTSLQNAARNVKAENRRETAQSSWVCQVYRRGIISPNNFIPLHIHNKPMVGLQNSVQNDRYGSGIFSKYVKVCDK